MTPAEVRAAVVNLVRAVLGMQIAHKGRSRLQAVAAQLLLGISGLALITFVCFQFGFGLARTGFAYLVLVALVSLLGSFSSSVVLSVLAAACLNYFFAPPLFELRVDTADDIVRIAAFLTTSLVVTALVTKLKRAEQELGESKVRLEEAQRLAHVGWWERNLITGRVTVSDEVSRILGARPVAQWLYLIHPEDRPRAAEAAAAAIRPGGPRYDVEYRVVRPDGTLRVVHSQGDVTWDDSGRALRKFGVLQDITELKQTEQELRASEARLEKAQRLAHVGWWERDFITAHVTLSDEVRRIFGVQPVDLPEWHGRWLELIHPDDRTRVVEAAEAAVRGGPRYDVEYRVIRPDGSEQIVHSQGDVTWDEAGKPLRQFGVLQDITQLRQAEEELRESGERFRTLVQFSFDTYWETDAEHRFTRQEFAEELPEAPARDEIGKTRWQVPYFEPDAEGWRKHRATIDAHLPFRDFEIARPAPEGGKRYVSASGLPVFDKSGRFVGYRGVARNITERKRAEEALRRSEAYLAEAQRLSHTGTLAFNATAPVYWSEESYRIWGLDPRQGLPNRETVLQRIHPEDRERVNVETEEALREKRGFTLEFRIVLPDGTVKHIESTGRPLFSADGEIVEMVATHVDVTERKRAQEDHERLRALEADLAHMNRLSIMGELTASLAHEILHPIATARNNARAAMRFLDMSPPNMAEVREALACIVRDADRGKDIVDRIRAHIKKAPPRHDRFDINEAIGEVIEMVRAPIEKNRVSVRTRLAAGLTSVGGDRVQLQQVVLNLILNAIEAMGSVEERARMLSISTEQREHEGILVAVHDSGPGVDPEHFQRVFEPFYTTKNSGLGMGLSICRSIIDAHGGRLWADTDGPRGAVFQFTLPMAHEDS